MAALYPIFDIPYPNFAMEEALAPGRVRPVAEVTPVGAVRAVESREDRPEGDRTTGGDAVEVSVASRDLASQVAGQKVVEERDSFLLARLSRENRAIRDLLASFSEYDNSAAQERFSKYLQLFVGLAPDSSAASRNERRGRDEVRARENGLYASLGFMPADITNEGGVMSQRIAVMIDAWLAGRGVFVPSMLGYGSSDGFRFIPFSGEARGALRAGEVLSSYERVRIAQYLREMARLTPEDFLFYDPTGLSELGLGERRSFLAEMGVYLEQARVDARAAELRYVFSEGGRLELAELGLRGDEAKRLEAFREAINTYYGMLRASVRQYGAGILSGMLGGASV